MKLPCASCYIQQSRNMQMRCRMQPINRELSDLKANGQKQVQEEFPTRSVTPSSLSASVNGVIRKHGATLLPGEMHAWIETHPGCLDILLAFVSIVAALVSAWSCSSALSSSDCPRGLWGVFSLFVSAATQMTVCDLLSSRSFQIASNL